MVHKVRAVAGSLPHGNKAEARPHAPRNSIECSALALAAYGKLFNDTPPAQGALGLQMAFRVAPDAVAACATAIEAKGVKPVLPLTDQPFGHRTVFFRDPDDNVVEIFAEI